MALWQIVVGFLIAFVLHNMWLRLKWRLGLSPLKFDSEQAYIAAKWAVRGMENHAKTQTSFFDLQMSTPESQELFATHMFWFAGAVIHAYCQQMQAPSYDLTPDRPAFRGYREAQKEV